MKFVIDSGLDRVSISLPIIFSSNCPSEKFKISEVPSVSHKVLIIFFQSSRIFTEDSKGSVSVWKLHIFVRQILQCVILGFASITISQFIPSGTATHPLPYPANSFSVDSNPKKLWKIKLIFMYKIFFAILSNFRSI